MLRAALACAALAANGALAVDTTQWPPPGGVEARMHELQQVIGSRESTIAQRDAAREELVGLLMSPGGRARGALAGEKRPPRAAIEPYPGVVAPVNIAPPAPPAGGVARIEVVVPPKPTVNPQTGTVLAPSSTFAIDPRTGNVLHGNEAGYIDPRTGRFTPRLADPR